MRVSKYIPNLYVFILNNIIILETRVIRSRSRSVGIRYYIVRTEKKLYARTAWNNISIIIY